MTAFKWGTSVWQRTPPGGRPIRWGISWRSRTVALAALSIGDGFDRHSIIAVDSLRRYRTGHFRVLLAVYPERLCGLDFQRTDRSEGENCLAPIARSSEFADRESCRRR